MDEPAGADERVVTGDSDQDFNDLIGVLPHGLHSEGTAQCARSAEAQDDRLKVKDNRRVAGPRRRYDIISPEEMRDAAYARSDKRQGKTRLGQWVHRRAAASVLWQAR